MKKFVSMPLSSQPSPSVGLDRNAPNYVFGVGYSFRLDGFLQRDRTLAPAASSRFGSTTR